MSVRVIGLGTAVPDGRIEQQAAATASVPLTGADDRQSRLLHGLYARSGVSTRHSVIVEGNGVGVRQSFYPARVDATDGGPSTSARMERYERHALEIAALASRRALADADGREQRGEARAITHLVTVSCTGFFAPGLDVGLIRALDLAPSVERTHVGFMGCHGLFNGLGVARALVEAEPRRQVLVCATELCSLHFQYGWDSQRLVANALFADGAAALLCTGGEGPAALRIEATGSFLVPDSEDAMTWRIRDHGFEMTLSPEVPARIRERVPGALRDWLGTREMLPEQIATWAVHPGGPRILSAFEEAVGLDPEALAVSRRVLADYGNMSSATIGFILDALCRSGAPGPGLAVGFGPGLIAELMLFRPDSG